MNVDPIQYAQDVALVFRVLSESPTGNVEQDLTLASDMAVADGMGVALAFTKRNVQAGLPLSVSLNLSGYFPLMAITMVEVGELSHTLTSATAQVSEFYAHEAEVKQRMLEEHLEDFLEQF